MSIPCPKCGTLLLGKVNRCWKCASPLEETSSPPPEKFPTIRPGAQLIQPSLAAAYASEEPIAAVPVEGTVADGKSLPGRAIGSGAAAISDRSGEPPAEPERIGSPFAAGSNRTGNVPRGAASGPAPSSTVPARRLAVENPNATLDRSTRQQVSRAGAYGVWALAMLAFAGMFFTSIGAACVAFLGLTFGMWGLYSDRKGWALAGAAACLALFLFAGFFAATDLYIHAFGRSPWTPPPAPSAGP